MAEESKSPERFSLSRWSRRKLDAARTAPPAAGVAPAPHAVPTSTAPSSDATALAPNSAPDAVPVARDLPPVDALTFESDFAAFLKPEVDPATQRAALKKLFSDPRFNVMDGLDTYIDDYTLADPMPAGMLDKLANVYAMLTKDAQRSDAQSVSAEEDHPAPAATGDPQAIEAAPPAADVPAPVPVAVAVSVERPKK